jgi:S1-C subfamily serine protease
MARTTQSPKTPDTTTLKRAITQLQALFGAGKVVPTDIMPENPAMNTALNAAAYLPNKIYGEGIVAPTNDITRNAMNLLQGQPPIPYEQLQSGATRLGYQAGAAINPMPGVPSDVGEGVGNALQGATPALTALLLRSITEGLNDTAQSTKGLYDAYRAAGRQAVPPGVPAQFQGMTLEQIRAAAHGVPANYFHDLESVKAAQNLQQYLPK